MNREGILKWATFILFGFLALLIAFFFMLSWYRNWNPFINDKPLSGTARASCPDANPVQIFPIYGGSKLYVYDPKQNETAPTVALRNNKNELKWCVYATGYKGTTASKLRFSDYKGFPFAMPRVRGSVESTAGQLSTWWFILPDGKLKGFWYGW